MNLSQSSSDNQTLVDRLIQEMGVAWERGQQTRSEDYLHQHPQLAQDPEAAARLIHEEICLRQERGEEISAAEIEHRFPQWRQALTHLLAFHRLIESQPDTPDFPEPGQTLGEFHLLAKLGSGALGQVYLATQSSLADRPVVVKMTADDGEEHLSLARLQHTNIVPLYGVQHFSDRNLRLLCMPFLGATTLKKLLDALRDMPFGKRTGLDILHALDQSRLAISVVPPPSGAERDVLQQSTYVEAVCWIGACLADGLHYAHERGLVHLDLKPSNVLFASDGQPMILDFHLARKPVVLGETNLDWMGGTPEYMSPEQRSAVEAIRRRQPIPGAVNGHSDIYSLGLVLYECLGGDMQRMSPWELPHANQEVSRGLADVIHKCLQEKPAARYGTAADLADDLRRHRENRPLRGVPNRSLLERWQKWRRRRPHVLPLMLALFAFAGAVLAAGLALTASLSERHRQVDNQLAAAKDLMAKGQYSQAIVALLEAEQQLKDLPASSDLTAVVSERLRTAHLANEAQKLEQIVAPLRFYPIWDSLPRRGLFVFDTACRNAWNTRKLLLSGDYAEFTPRFYREVQTNLYDLAILWSDLRLRLAPPDGKAAAHQHAVSILDEVTKHLGPNCVICREQAVHARSLQHEKLATKLEAQAAALVPKSPWEHYALGRFWLRQGNLEKAEQQLQKAVTLDPQGFLPHYYYGVCCYRRGNHENAVLEFTFCIGKLPMAECYFQRGLAFVGLGRQAAARKDRQEALKKGGLDPAMVHFRFGQAQAKHMDWDAARSSLQQALNHEPNHPQARKLLNELPK